MRQGRRPSVALSLFLLFIALIGFFAAGYGLMSLIYRWTGTPPDFWSYLLSSLVGIVLFGASAAIARPLIVRFGHANQNFQAMQSQLLNAMTRIAQGDFDGRLLDSIPEGSEDQSAEQVLSSLLVFIDVGPVDVTD